MDMPPNDGLKRKIFKIARILLISGFALFCLYIFFNYLISWFLPFIIAWIIALIIQPAVGFLHSKLKLPPKLATVVFLLFFFAALGTVLFFAVDRIIYELTLLWENFSVNEVTEMVSDILNGFFEWFEKSLDNLPFFSEQMIDNIRLVINAETLNVFSRFGADIVSQIPSFIASLIKTIPKILVYTLISIISTFYIAFDFKNINKSLALQAPPKVRAVMSDIKSRFLEAIYKYIRAYFTIFIIVYSELTVGFLIVGVNYAFIIALVIALIDIVPVLGTGTVLIPWGLISIIQKDYFTGIALLILYAVITIVRNIIEPKIVGSSIGLYPVVTLIAIFVGFNAFGIAGLFLLPITVLILKNLNNEGKIHIWKTEKKDGEDKNGKGDGENDQNLHS